MPRGLYHLSESSKQLLSEDMTEKERNVNNNNNRANNSPSPSPSPSWSMVVHPLADFSSSYPSLFVFHLKHNFIHSKIFSTFFFRTSLFDLFILYIYIYIHSCTLGCISTLYLAFFCNSSVEMHVHHMMIFINHHLWHSLSYNA